MLEDHSDEPIDWEHAVALVDQAQHVFETVEKLAYCYSFDIQLGNDEVTIRKHSQTYRQLVECLKQSLDRLQGEVEDISFEEFKNDEPILDWEGVDFILGQLRGGFHDMKEVIRIAESRHTDAGEPAFSIRDVQVYRYLIAYMRKEVLNLRSVTQQL